MKKLLIFLLILTIVLTSGCSKNSNHYDIVATTLPVYDFTASLCEETGLKVGRVITESVSCLHDYTLQVSQMQMIEGSDVVVISGAGLEDFLDDALTNSRKIIDASEGTHIHSNEYHGEHEEDHNHTHEHDPHIWLSMENASIMAQNICNNLCGMYPQYHDIFLKNLDVLLNRFELLQRYGQEQLADLTTKELITFHDGFAYFAKGLGLTILEAVEEESGSEASAAEIIHLVELVNERHLPAIFIETNGSNACAGIIAAETGAQIFTLDMAMSGDSYFDAMYHNINTVKEALG